MCCVACVSPRGQELFEGVTPVISYDDAALEKLLDRSQIKGDDETPKEAGHTLGNFSYARVWEQEAQAPGALTKSDDPEYWKKLLASRIKVRTQR